MIFTEVQNTLRDAIAASATFAPDAAATVLKDLGASKAAIENAELVKGYCVAVWPPTQATATPGDDATQGAEFVSVVRLTVNPQKLKALRAQNASDDGYINTLLAGIFKAVLGLAPGLDNNRFQLAPNAFELMTFDEGLIAYHLRFTRFAVFGT